MLGESSKFKVFPKDPETTPNRVIAGLLALLFAVLCGWIAFTSGLSLPSLNLPLVVAVALYTSLLFALVAYGIYRSLQRSSLSVEYMVASTSTCQALERLQKCHTFAQRAQEQLELATGLATKAREEFTARAYPAFWDLIEQATAAVAKAFEVVQSLPQCCQEYRSALVGKNHNFPPELLEPMDFSKISECLMDIKELVRKGQCDFEFAMIFEQRSTRQVIIAGFTGVVSALQGIESGIRTIQAQLAAPTLFVNLPASRL
jgi:hypothetical protein